MTDTNPRIVGGGARDRAVALAWPVAHGAATIDAIHVRRLTVKEVADYIEALRASPPEAVVRFPMYCDAAGAPIPPEVLDALDDDDMLALEEAARDFLPRRFRAEAAPPPGSGAATAEPSPT